MKKKKEEGALASLEETHYRTLLQEALSFVLPERQAQRFTAMLLERFGSFAGVFLAPEEELAALLGEKRAPRYLRLTTELARAYLEDSSRDLKHVYDTDSAVELFRPKLLGRTTEAVCLMLLDGQARLLYNDILSEGSISAVPVYIRRLLQLCIRYDAQHVLLAHNHPSGNAAASQNDIVATRQVEMALESIDATLNDHIIFAGDDYHSFAKSGWLWTAKREVRRQRQEELQASREEEREILRRGGLL